MSTFSSSSSSAKVKLRWVVASRKIRIMWRGFDPIFVNDCPFVGKQWSAGGIEQARKRKRGLLVVVLEINQKRSEMRQKKNDAMVNHTSGEGGTKVRGVHDRRF